MRMKLIAALLLVSPALFLMPLERHIHAERVRMKYGGPAVPLKLRDRIGQGMAIGLLAGFRGVVADFVWIGAHDYWEKKEWLREYRNIEVATTLQPQSITFWDLGSWHLAWNIGHAVRTDTNNLTKAQGLKREREWHIKARDFLERGIENVPNQYDLYFRLGWLYAQKFPGTAHCGADEQCQREAHCKAALYMKKAAEFKEAPTYTGRLYANELERCGDKMASYEYWKYLWNQSRSTPGQLWTVVERNVKRLEDELKIPEDQRVPRNADGSLRAPP